MIRADQPVTGGSGGSGDSAGRRGNAPRTERTAESLALVVGAGGFVIAAASALIAFRLQSAPIAGPGSLGQFVAITAALLTLPCVYLGGHLAARGLQRSRPALLDRLDLAAIAVAHALLVLLGATVLSALLADAFPGAEVFPLSAILISGATVAVTAYATFSSGMRMDAQRLALLLVAFLVVGILASMLTTDDPHWWQEHLSALGATTSAAARAFNVTLFLSGLLVVALARVCTRDIPAPDARARSGVGRVRACLVGIGICLSLVGVFPVDVLFLLHTAVALGMLVVFGVVVVRLPRWIPGLPVPFILLGRVFLAVTFVLAIFYLVGYYTLTAVELIAGALVFSWVALFIRNVAALERDAAAAAHRPPAA